MIDPQTIGILLAFIAALAWGSASVLYRLIMRVENSSILFSVTIRGIFAVPVIAIITLFTTQFSALEILLRADVLPILILSSIFVAIGDVGFFGAMQRMEVSKAQPIGSMYPLFASFLAVAFGLETINTLILVGTIVIISGISLISQQRKQNVGPKKEGHIKNNPTLGTLLAILGAVGWGFAIFTLTFLLQIPGMESLTLATLRFGILTVLIGFIWIGTLFYNKTQSNGKKISNYISKKNVLTLGLGGIISWAIGGVCFFISISMIDSVRAVPISSINPLIAVALGTLILGEKLNKVQFSGILLVTLGSILISIS
ncbi:MAG: DMT family transporter [Candidatus Hodarchaeales archaeon]